jgi:hypothetical protein
MQSSRYSCQILMKPEFSRQIFKKFSYMEFHENSSSWSRVIPCGGVDRRTDGRTDRYDEGNSRFSEFWESA